MATDWDAIVGDYGPMVWKTVYRLVGNHADAADCYQETFLDAVRAERREAVVCWPAFLKRLATARSLDRLRQRIRERGRTSAEPQWQLVHSGDPGPVQYAEAGELVVQLRESLAHIPADQAEAFCLRAMDSLSYEEIAKQMGVSVSAVGVLLHRARERLQTLLADVKQAS